MSSICTFQHYSLQGQQWKIHADLLCPCEYADCGKFIESVLHKFTIVTAIVTTAQCACIRFGGIVLSWELLLKLVSCVVAAINYDSQCVDRWPLGRRAPRQASGGQACNHGALSVLACRWAHHLRRWALGSGALQARWQARVGSQAYRDLASQTSRLDMECHLTGAGGRPVPTRYSWLSTSVLEFCLGNGRDASMQLLVA